MGRLRLVHAKYQKRVFLLSNLPVEVPVDRLVPFNDLMPDRLELELIRRGNIPLTPLGLLKMRPDVASNNEQAKKLLQQCFLPFLRKDRTIKPWDQTPGQSNHRHESF